MIKFFSKKEAQKIIDSKAQDALDDLLRFPEVEEVFKEPSESTTTITTTFTETVGIRCYEHLLQLKKRKITIPAVKVFGKTILKWTVLIPYLAIEQNGEDISIDQLLKWPINWSKPSPNFIGDVKSITTIKWENSQSLIAHYIIGQVDKHIEKYAFRRFGVYFNLSTNLLMREGKCYTKYTLSTQDNNNGRIYPRLTGHNINPIYEFISENYGTTIEREVPIEWSLSKQHLNERIVQQAIHEILEKVINIIDEADTWCQESISHYLRVAIGGQNVVDCFATRIGVDPDRMEYREVFTKAHITMGLSESYKINRIEINDLLDDLARSDEEFYQ